MLGRSGSGVLGIVAATRGATVNAIDVDPFGNVSVVGVMEDEFQSAGYLVSLRQNGSPRWSYILQPGIDAFAHLDAVASGPNGQVWAAGTVETDIYPEGYVLAFPNPPG